MGHNLLDSLTAKKYLFWGKLEANFKAFKWIWYESQVYFLFKQMNSILITEGDSYFFMV